MKTKWHTIRVSQTVRLAIIAENLGMHDTYDKILARKYKLNIVKRKEHENESKESKSRTNT